MFEWTKKVKVVSGFVVTIFLFVTISSLGQAQNFTHHLALPFIAHDLVRCDPKNPSKGVAWAYGRQTEDDEDRLCISTYHAWSLKAEDEGIPGLHYMNVFWSDIYTSPTGNEVNYFTELERKLGNDYDGMMLFLNEPELDVQADKTPLEGAQMYRDLKAQCPNCQLYGPMVSAYDHQCLDNGQQRPYYDELRAKYGQWCWFQEWWHQVELLTGAPPEMAGYTIHHTLGRAVAPLAPIDSLEATVASLGDNRPFNVIVSEYGIVQGYDITNCDPDFMAEMTDAYAQDSRVLYFYAYTPNIPHDNWCTFFAPFGTAHFTPTGFAFASHGNRK